MIGSCASDGFVYRDAIEDVRLQRLLRLLAPVVPARASVVRQTAGRRLAVPVVVRQAVAKRCSGEIDHAAVLGKNACSLVANVER